MAGVRVAAQVNRLVVPRMRALGFSLEPPDRDDSWREGRFFSRRGSSGEQVVMIGRDKFGQALGVNVARQKPDGTYEYLVSHTHGLPRDALRYEDADGLQRVLRSLLDFIEKTAVPWLDGA